MRKSIQKVSLIAVTAIGLIACQGEKKAPAEMAKETMVKETMIPEKEMVKVVYDTNDVNSLLIAVAEANGGQKQLRMNKDVAFEYYYTKPDGMRDVSEERYIFDGEISWAKYTEHNVNVPADLEGDVVQYFDGKSASCYVGGTMMEDPKLIGMGQFLRQANYMWFSMMFKLSDPGTISSYQGRKEHKGEMYDMVQLSYDSTSTGKAQNDAYVLYINPKTHLVDYFNFSLPAMGVNVPALHAELHYEEIDGIQVVVERNMFAPNPETGEMAPMVGQKLMNVKFNNGYTKEILADMI